MNDCFQNSEAHCEESTAYHGRPEISASMIKCFAEEVGGSPEAFFRDYVVKASKDKSSSAMEFGSVLHEDVLLELWERSYEVIPVDVLAKNGSKLGNAWKEYKEANKGRILLKTDELMRADECRLAIANNPLACSLLQDELIAKEQTITAEFMRDDIVVGVRGRIDYLRSDRIVDLKSIHDMSARNMKYAPIQSGWHVQAAMYQGLVFALRGELLPVDFVVVETSEPFRSGVYSVSDQSMEDGYRIVANSIREMIDRRSSGDWYSRGHGTRVYF